MPPDSLRPGQIGTLIDEQANPLDVTATIIDLAVRSYLRIDEIPKEDWVGMADWRLVQLPADEPNARLREDALDRAVRYRRRRQLSSLKNHFATSLRSCSTALRRRGGRAAGSPAGPTDATAVGCSACG